jgi:hypothetical protein
MRRISLGLLLLVAAIVLLCAFTKVDERLAASLVGRRLGADVEIGSLGWRLDGHLRAHDVHATLPGARERFFGVERVDLDLGLFPPRLESVVLVHPHVVATERADGRIDLQDLIHPGASQAPPPPMRVEGGELELRGDGPITAKLRGALAAGAPARIDVERLSLQPGSQGRVALDGVLSVPGLVRVHVDGALAAGRLERVVAWVAEGDALDLGRLREQVAPSIAKWLAENEVSGAIAPRAAVAWTGERPEVTADVQLLGIAVKPAVFPTKLTEVRGWIHLRDGDVVFDDLAGRHGTATVSATGGVKDVAGAARTHVVVRVDNGAMDDELRAALERIPIGAEVLASLAPEGRGSATATIDHDPTMELPHVAIELDLEDVSGVFHGFVDSTGRRRGLPMRVERVRGHVHATPEETTFEHCVGFTRGGARVEASAAIHGDDASGEAHAFDAPIDDELLAALDSDVSPHVRELLVELGLTGRFDAHAKFDVHGHELALALDLEPRAIELVPPAFPYRVLLDGGHVRVDATSVKLEALHGTAGSATVRIDGDVGIGSDTEPDPPVRVTLAAQHLPFDEKLLAACRALENARVAALLAEAAPKGELDLTVTWTRVAPGDPIDLSIRLQPRDVTMNIAAGTAVASALSGAVTLTRRGDGVWQADFETESGLTARLFEGTVRITGRSDESASGSVRLSGGGLRLGPELRAALAPIAPDLARLLESHAVEGRVRVRCELAPRDARLTPVQLDVEPDMADVDATDAEDGVSIAPPWLGLPVRWLEGSIHADLDSKKLTFDRLFGLLGDAHLTIDQGGVQRDDTGFAVTFSAEIDALPFGQWIRLVFGTERWRSMLPYGPLGRTRVALHELMIHQPDDGATVDHITGRGDIDFQGWTFYTGGGLKELTGRLEVLDLQVDRDAAGAPVVRADGRLAGVTLDVGGPRFANLECDLLLAENRLSVPWLSADLAGGRLPRERNHLGITLVGDMPFDGRLELDSADVSRILGDDQARMRDLVGRLDADVGFRGAGATLMRGEGVTKLEAAGTVSIRDAKLWTIPVFDKLYSGAIVPMVGTSEDEKGESEPPKWNRGDFQFALQGPNVRLSRIELEGEPLLLRGQGTLGPDRLDINFYPEVKSGIGMVRNVPVLGWIVGLFFSFLERQVGSFRFQGPYKSPEVQWDPVSLMPRPDLAIPLDRPRVSSQVVVEPERF